MIDATVKTDVATAPLLPLTTRLGPVHLAVTDAGRALAIWRDVVGLEVISESDAQLELGVGGTVLIVLEPGATQPVVPRSLGLYHVALHVPDRADLAHLVIRALGRNVRIAPTDHLISEAIYLWDLDGNGIEITFETPWRGRLADPATGHYALTAEGKPHSGRDPIDLKDLLSEIDIDAPQPHLPSGTRIGHIHVHVADLTQAMEFYRDVVGFAGFLLIDSFGMGDVGLDYMPHTVAFNIWSGSNAVQPPAGAAGLQFFTIAVPDVGTLDDVAGRLAAANIKFTRENTTILTADPSGNRIRIVVFS